MPEAVPVLDLRRLERLWQVLGATRVDGSANAALACAYAEPARHYHTARHITECLAWFDRASQLATRPAEVEAAIWFHDCVYDISRHDNESRSAQWFADVALTAGVAGAVVERVRDLISSTSHDVEVDTDDARLLIDVDLSILGAAPERFRDYEHEIRLEYAVVPEPRYRAGRLALLERFLERPFLYHTDFFREHLERAARRNLTASIAALRGG
jgi:predicted metal-dependent HD superfamily phosphohydrolase